MKKTTKKTTRKLYTRGKGDDRPVTAAPTPTPKVLVLRVCNADMSSQYNFVWPKKGPVAAPDWRADKECGHGLHGWLWGEGNINVARVNEDSVWLVVEVDASDVVDLGGKIKFPKGNVLFAGDVKTATDMIYSVRPGAIIKGTATAGVRGTATAGYAGTATAGVRGTATAGVRGTATAGVRGTATAGYAGTATAGVRGTATAGVRGTATAGYAGTATAGVRGTATAGVLGHGDRGRRGHGDRGRTRARRPRAYAGTATAGVRGTATAGVLGHGDRGRRGHGDRGRLGHAALRAATAGVRGTATLGHALHQKVGWPEVPHRDRMYVGEKGILPNVAYRLEGAIFVPVKK
jgi:hypothetical protein